MWKFSSSAGYWSERKRMQKVSTSSTKYGRVAETCFSVFQNELRTNYEGKYHFLSQGLLCVMYFWKWRYYPLVVLLIDCRFTCVFDVFVMLSIVVNIVSCCILDVNLNCCSYFNDILQSWSNIFFSWKKCLQ